MNPYVSFGLAMCLVVAVSLFFTAYLAVHFNRRAKTDMQAALAPLGELIDGDVDVEEARVQGRFRGQIAEGRAANATDGPGRVFLTSVIDSAGGTTWSYTVRFPKEPDAAAITKVEGFDEASDGAFLAEIERVVQPLITRPGWGRVEYDPGAGHVRLTRPMVTRRDIPNVERFREQLEVLVALGDRNRVFQERKSE